jgi:heme/copper-type cytochrome/quinol oxidase subunit 2
MTSSYVENIVSFFYFIYTVLTICLTIFGLAAYVSCKSEADYLNKNYGTNYTAKDMFFTGEMIKITIMNKELKK